MRQISISHWGMFEMPQPPLMVIPPGFKLTEDDLAELRKPGRLIVMDRASLSNTSWR